MIKRGFINEGVAVISLIVCTSFASGEPLQANNTFVVDLPYPSHFLYSLQLFNLSFPFFVNVSDPVQTSNGSFGNVLERPVRPLAPGVIRKFKREQGAQKLYANGRLMPAPENTGAEKPSLFGSRDPSWKNVRYDYFTRRTTTRPPEAVLTTTRPALQTSPFRLRSSNRLAVKRGYKLHNDTATGVQIFHVVPRINAVHLKQQTQNVGSTEGYFSVQNPTTGTLPLVATTTAFPAVLPTSRAYVEGVVVRPGEVSFSTERIPRSQSVFFAANQLEGAAKDDRVTTYNPPFAKFAFSPNFPAENSTQVSVALKESSSFPEKISSALVEVTKLLSISTQEKPGRFEDDRPSHTTAKSTLDEDQPVQDKTVTPTQLPKPDVSLHSPEEPEGSKNATFQSFLIPASYYSTTESSEDSSLDAHPASDEVSSTSAESSTENVDDLIRKYIGSHTVTPAPRQEATLHVSASTETTVQNLSTSSTSLETTTTSTTTTAPTVSQLPVTTAAPLLPTPPSPSTQLTPSVVEDKPDSGISTNTTIVSVTTTPLALTNVTSSFPNFPATQLATPDSNNPTNNPLFVQGNTNSLPGAQLNFPSFPAPQFNTASSPQFNLASSNIGATLGNITSLGAFNQHFPGISVFEALVSLQTGGSNANSASSQGQQVNLQAGGNGFPFGNSAQNPYLVSGFSSASDGSTTPGTGDSAGVNFGQQSIPPNFANQLSFQFPVQQQNHPGTGTTNLLDFASLSQNIQQNPALASQSFAFGSSVNFPQANGGAVSAFPNQLGNFQQNLGIAAFNPAQFGAITNGAAQTPGAGVLNAQFINLPGQAFSLNGIGTAAQPHGNTVVDTTQAGSGGSPTPQ